MLGVLALITLSAACGSSSTAASPPTPSAPAGSVATAAPGTTEHPAPAVAHPSDGCRAASPTPAGTETRSLATPAGERTYRITRPAGGSTAPSPLVLLFHGFAGTAESFSTLTKLPERGAAQGMVVVAPDGAGAGAGATKTWQFSGRGTDAGFVDALITEVTATSCIDLDRINATGFSAGAAFTIAYACAHQDRIHAIVTVAVDFQLGCTTPQSILAFHGTVDPLVPYENEAVGLSLPGVKVRGTDLNMGDWATLGGCAATPVVEKVGTEVTHSTWTGCTGNAEVELYAIVGGGHTWPGADPAKAVGLTTQQVDATTEALAFFSRPHAPPTAAS